MVRVRSRGVELAPEPKRVRKEVHRPANAAVMLALAHRIDRAIHDGKFVDQADVARRLGFTRARITHLLYLVCLAPDIQLEVLQMVAKDGKEPISERALREVAIPLDWDEQRARFRKMMQRPPRKRDRRVV